MPRRSDLRSVCLIGSGPIVIGQACEFDYAGCQALKVLRQEGFRTIVVNSNPATIMTDPGFADRTYLEPLDLEGVTSVLERERPDALLPTMGGQTALNLARELAESGTLAELGVELIGAPVDVIARAEDRELFREAVQSVGLRVPRSKIVTDELPNDLVRTTPAGFEPTLDYVVVKFPRFAFEKFPGADRTLGTQMKSVGEAMGIGRTFVEAYRKAERSRELDREERWELPASAHPWFHAELAREPGWLDLDAAVADDFVRYKRAGLADGDIGREDVVRAKRRAWGVRPAYRRVDSCAGEVDAASTYYYSTYGEADEAPPTGTKPRVVILGSGPNRIGQGIEFDYCCVHAAQSFRGLGFEAVMVNCNPETVSTDYDTSDRLYFEPLRVEEVLA